MANDTPGQNFWDELVMQPVLSQAEKALRDKFVDEYLLDFDSYAAALRVGFLKSVANEYASQFMEDVYVRQRIMQRQTQTEASPKEATKMRRRLTEMALLREANYRGEGASHSARVSALAKLASIYDMDAPLKTKSEITHRGGVMMIPAIANLDDWEKAAQASQQQLVDEARQ